MIEISVRGAVGVITLGRPEENNTFTLPFAGSLNDALMELDAEECVRVVIVKASGKNFSFGISLEEFNGKTRDQYRTFIRRMDEHNHTIARMKKPVIAMVHGVAAANGAGLAFACDFTVAASDTRFGTTAVNVGLICLGPAGPMMGIIGRKKTLEMLLTGEMLGAEEALRLGLINKVVPPDKLEEETFAFAENLAAKSPLAVQTGKRGVYALAGEEYHKGLDRMSDMFADLCAHPDAEEGVTAFLRKRKPVWGYR